MGTNNFLNESGIEKTREISFENLCEFFGFLYSVTYSTAVTTLSNSPHFSQNIDIFASEKPVEKERGSIAVSKCDFIHSCSSINPRPGILRWRMGKNH